MTQRPSLYDTSMSSLKELLLAPAVRSRVVDDCTRLVEAEVQSKSGLSGMAIKTGFKAVSAIKPTLIREAVDGLLDRFVDQLEPFYAEWHGNGRSSPFESYIGGRANKVANALLAVTDAKARSIGAGTIKKTYEMLRPQGEKNVEAAVPALARMVSRYLS